MTMKNQVQAQRCCRRVAAAALLGASLTVMAQADQKAMQRYGGVFAPECGNYLLPQLLFLGDTLVVRDQGKALLTGRNVKPAPAGAFKPDGFEAAFTSQVAPGESLIFVLTRDAAGVYATVDGSPRVMQTLPAALNGKRIRHCDPNRNAVPGSAPPVQNSPWDLLKDPAFKQAYLRALGPLAKEPWLTVLDGPAPPVRPVQVAGAEYQLATSCKPHDCYDNTLVLLWAAGSRTVYGKVVQGSRSTPIGAPPPAVAAELDRLWKTEFRR
jgi:Inhibitor of vertebrate lysozyme (Ivy)